ncbi:MAG: hypothetical protein QOC96_3228 [Acidobacteriota bacterium]|jgi:hypothetical protein|nr:hypothetical protein [Acidobacteriota bacterium]
MSCFGCSFVVGLFPLGDEVACGICIPGIFIFIFSGEAEGFVEEAADGICIPGMFICSGEALGTALGVRAGIPVIAGMFMFIFRAGAFLERVDTRDEAGMFILFMLIPRIPPLVRVGFLRCVVDFDLLLALPIFMPGMFCISCSARTGTARLKSSPTIVAAQSFARRLDCKLFTIPSRMF